MSAKKPKQILFVCTGNTCRSPMAQALLAREISRLGIEGFEAKSAGLAASKEGKLNPLSEQVLNENGLCLDGFCSTLLDEKLLTGAKAIVCMTESQRDEVAYARWRLLTEKGRKRISDNVYAFSAFCGRDVPDPYGYGVEEYRFVFSMLEGGMYALMDKILGKELRAMLRQEMGESDPAPVKKKKTSKKTASKKA